MHDLKDFRGATKILITKQNCLLCFSGTFLQCSFLLYPERQHIAINHYILSTVVVNLIGDSHTKDFYIFRLWGVIEMQRLNYSVPKSLLNEILQKYQNSIHM